MLEVFYFFGLCLPLSGLCIQKTQSVKAIQAGAGHRVVKILLGKQTSGHEVQSESFILLSIFRIQATQPAQMVQ